MHVYQRNSNMRKCNKLALVLQSVNGVYYSPIKRSLEIGLPAHRQDILAILGNEKLSLGISLHS